MKSLPFELKVIGILVLGLIAFYLYNMLVIALGLCPATSGCNW